jgi:hypothetical protein
VLAHRTQRGFGRIILALLFLLSVFQLTHTSAGTQPLANDLWRALAAGTLFLFFCVPSSGRS